VDGENGGLRELGGCGKSTREGKDGEEEFFALGSRH